MPDIFSTLSAVVSTAQKLREVSNKIEDAETRNLIADLNLELADLKMQAAELQEEKAELQAQLRKMQEAEDLSGKIETRDGLYYLTERLPGKSEGPYCPSCFESDQNLIPVSELPTQLQTLGSYKCPSCSAVY